MLIPSHRHTAKDLELWREYEAADLRHAETNSAKVDRSLAAIDLFASRPCYGSVSWGKDSVVMSHLIYRAAPHVQLWFVRPVNRQRTPERDLVRDYFLDRFPVNYDEIDIPYSKEATDQECEKLFFSAFRSIGERHITGIRADESTGRKIRMLRHGLESPNTLAPLGWWTAADVFAYLAKNGLPVHPTYAMLGGGRWDRSQLRVDDLGGSRGRGIGREEWEREYYGDVLRRLESR